MNNTSKNIVTELMSVCKLKECLLKTQKIIPVINDMDKEPIWDGSLYVYKGEADIVNDSFLDRIPIQLKGTCKFNYKNSKISYPINVSNLNHYKKDGGVIFFVVVMGKSYNKFSIFYKILLPFDILRILNNKESQSSINVQMDKFPIDNTEKMMSIFISFINNKGKQSGTAEQGLQMREKLYNGVSKEELNIKDFTFSVSKDTFKDINNSVPTYIYARDKNNIELPIDVVTFDIISTEQLQKVIIGDDEYSCNVELTKSAKGDSIIIENSITIFIPNNKPSLLNVKFKLSDDLDERITTLRIIKSIYKYKDVYITNVFSGRCENFDSIDMNDITERLIYYNKIKKTLSLLNINKKFNMKNITQTDIFLLSALVKSLVDNENFDDKIQFNNPIGTLTISNLKMIVYGYKTKSGKRLVKVPSPKELKGYISFEDGTENKYPITICSILKKKDFITIDNLSYAQIYNSTIECGYNSETSGKINEMGLEIISAYDVCQKQELLDTATDIFKWLMANDNQDIFTINYYQCIKRKQSLSDNDIDVLIHLKDHTNDKISRWGVNLLLDNKNEMDYCWKQLSNQEQEIIKQYPIYNLYNE